MSFDLVAPPYGPFVTRRGVRINGQVLERTDGGTEAGKNISNARYEVHLRSYASPDATALVHDFTLDKSATNAATGYYDDYVSFGATAYSSGLWWEEILIDTNVIDANTVSGKDERILRRWRQAVEDAAP